LLFVRLASAGITGCYFHATENSGWTAMSVNKPLLTKEGNGGFAGG